MEDIVHYKHVDEKFHNHISVVVEVEETTTDPFGEGIEVKTKRGEVKRDIVKITADELKEAMSRNDTVSISRETIIVSEDFAKNTVSLKRFVFNKTLVPIRKINRKKFKILNQTMYSLTINKTTGDFSYYERKKNPNHKKRGFYFYVRKNISFKRLRTMIENVFRYDFKDEMKYAIMKFYEIVGYEPLLNYRQFMNKYLPPEDEAYFNPVYKHSLPILPFINYIRKKNIKDVTYEQLYLFEYIFKKDKKKYYNKSMYEYLRDFYNIKDDRLFERSVKELKEQTKTAILDQRADHQTKKPHERDHYNFVYPGFNEQIISLIYRYNLSPSRYNELSIITSNFYEVDERHKLPLVVYRMVDLYGFDIVEIINMLKEMHINHIKKRMIELEYFATFNVKLNIKRFEDYVLNYKSIYHKIYDSLCYSRAMTGTFYLEPQLVNAVRNELLTELGDRMILNQGSKPNERDYRDYNSLPISDDGNEHVKNLYNFESCLPKVTFINDITNDRVDMIISHITHENTIRRYNKTAHFENALNYIVKLTNEEKIRIKQIYSKKYFEDVLMKKYKLNSEEHIVYID